MTVRESTHSQDASIRPRLNAVYDPKEAPPDQNRAPAMAEGLFLRSPPKKEG